MELWLTLRRPWETVTSLKPTRVDSDCKMSPEVVSIKDMTRVYTYGVSVDQSLGCTTINDVSITISLSLSLSLYWGSWGLLDGKKAKPLDEPEPEGETIFLGLEYQGTGQTLLVTGVFDWEEKKNSLDFIIHNTIKNSYYTPWFEHYVNIIMIEDN